MKQLEFFQIPSPCVGVCRMDEKGYCQGCMRKRDERLAWLEMDATQKKHVIKLCQQRYRRKLISEKGKSVKKESTEGNSDTQGSLF